jgi:alkyl sulfatase BDS1-like metallo-beta-lactamase superfamily hydrolase
MGHLVILAQWEEYDSINPSLQRQSPLNMEYGLFEVVPGIYCPLLILLVLLSS